VFIDVHVLTVVISLKYRRGYTFCQYRIHITIRQIDLSRTGRNILCGENDGRVVDVDFVCTASPAAGALWAVQDLLGAVWKTLTVDTDDVR